jgi:hypothetical protein
MSLSGDIKWLEKGVNVDQERVYWAMSNGN